MHVTALGRTSDAEPFGLCSDGPTRSPARPRARVDLNIAPKGFFISAAGDRTPRVSSGPVSAARKERPALLHPKASRGACQRGTPDAIPASGEDKRDVRSESLPLGALGGCFVESIRVGIMSVVSQSA